MRMQRYAVAAVLSLSILCPGELARADVDDSGSSVPTLISTGGILFIGAPTAILFLSVDFSYGADEPLPAGWAWAQIIVGAIDVGLGLSGIVVAEEAALKGVGALSVLVGSIFMGYGIAQLVGSEPEPGPPETARLGFW